MTKNIGGLWRVVYLLVVKVGANSKDDRQIGER